MKEKWENHDDDDDDMAAFDIDAQSRLEMALMKANISTHMFNHYTFLRYLIKSQDLSIFHRKFMKRILNMKDVKLLPEIEQTEK